MLQHPVFRHFAALLTLFIVACFLLRSGIPLSAVDQRASIDPPAADAQPQLASMIGRVDTAPRITPSATPKARPGVPAESADEVLRPDQHRMKRGESVTSVARTWISRTSYMTVPELEASIRETNGLKEASPKPGDVLTIPGFDIVPIVEHPVARPRDFEVRAIYLTGAMAGSDNGIRLIRHWREVGGNAIVFDIKDSDGSVNVPFQHPLVGNQHVAIRNLPKFIRFLH